MTASMPPPRGRPDSLARMFGRKVALDKSDAEYIAEVVAGMLAVALMGQSRGEVGSTITGADAALAAAMLEDAGACFVLLEEATPGELVSDVIARIDMRALARDPSVPEEAKSHVVEAIRARLAARVRPGGHA